MTRATVLVEGTDDLAWVEGVHLRNPPCYALTGPAVKDLDGNLLILTSREFLSLAEEFCVTGGGEIVGRRPSGYFHSEGHTNTAIRLVGWFIPSVSVKVSTSNVPRRVARTGKGLLSSDLFMPRISKAPVGDVSGVNCLARFKLTGIDTPVVIDGLSGA